MARGDEDATRDALPSERPRAGPGAVSVALAVSALPAVALAVAAVTGLGLARNLAALPAVAGAVALVLLPIFGLASLVRGGQRVSELASSAWLWCLTVLLAMPFYFPGERADATRSGLALLTGPVSGGPSERVVNLGSRVVELLGDEPAPAPLASPLPAADALRPADGARRARTVAGEVVVPYEGRGETLRVNAFFDGPRYGEEFPMIFDTGATYTTLDRASLALLEVPIPDDAPVAVLRTANGEVEAPLVLVDAVWLGDAVVEWVTIAVCDTCATDEVSGLLGLNVSGQFQVSLDHDRRQIQLAPLEGEENRKLDIGQWVGVRSRMLRWRDGRLEVEVTGDNRARVGLRDLTTEIECPGGRFEVVVDEVPARSSASRTMALPRGTDCSEYAVSLRRGNWDSNRFD